MGYTEQDLKIINRERIIEKKNKQLENYKSVYSRYEKIERLCSRAEAIVTYPLDKMHAARMIRIFNKPLKEGLNSEKREKRIIVSLTSYPKRIETTPIAIASMLRQTRKPDKIVLYLANEDFPEKKLPKIYRKVKNSGVEIRFRKDLKVHMKYFYALQEFSEDLVVTIDDDVFYANTLIERLYQSYKAHPNFVHAAYVDQLMFDDECHLLNYADWNHKYINMKRNVSNQFMALGVGGVLYPPHLLCAETFNRDAIKAICPTNDDIWLKFMEVISGTKVWNLGIKSTGKVLRDTQRGIALGILNMSNNGNDRQLKAMLEHYNGWFEGYSLEELMAYDVNI